MTLRELRAAHYDRFHRQDWFDDEPFLDREPWPHGVVAGVRYAGDLPHDTVTLPSAATLAALFVADPTAKWWKYYLWTSDHDRFGQRVYVGGACPENGHRFEIHRHLAITDKWASPVIL